MRFASAVCISLILVGLSLPVSLGAEEANVAEAGVIAANYLEYLDARFASWGGDTTPSVASVDELVDDAGLLGWVFHVEPEGFLVVSRHKELGAVKAWSAHGHFDVADRKGTSLLLRDLMSRNIDGAEGLIGRSVESITSEQWESIAAFDYKEAWTHPPVAPTKVAPKSFGNAGMNYREGEVLLTTNWHQHDPFNRPFPEVSHFDTNGQWVVCRDHAVVGCVATAAAQIMRYWAWPPAAADGTYVDRYWWTHMPDEVFATSPQDQIDAVSELSYNLAVAVDMDFRCDGSFAHQPDMEDVLQNRRYDSAAHTVDRCDLVGVNWDCDTPTDWYNRLKNQFNVNRPVQYEVLEHSIVGDGWYEVEVGGTTERWYHFNYGWTDTEDDIWYLLDALHLGHPYIDSVLTSIRPDLDVGPTISGFYPTEWLSANHFDRPSRYFDLDVTGDNAEFEAGQGLQYVRPGFWIRNTGTSVEDEIVFHGDPEAATEFYHEAPFGDVKMRISDGTVVIRGGGEMALY